MKKIVLGIIILICVFFSFSATAAENEFTRASFCKKITEVLEIEIDSSILENRFSDLEGTEDYYNSVLWMVENGYMVGYEDGEFKSTKPITNGEVAKILINITVGDFKVPSDVVLGNAWYAKYAWKAKQLRVMPNVEIWDELSCETDIDYEVLKSLFKNEPYTIDSGTCGQNLTWSINNVGLLSISGYGKMNNFSVDNSPWYQYKDDIKKVIISDGVENIGNSAFYVCRGLTEVSIPDSVLSIGNFAFGHCDMLENVFMSTGVNFIDTYAFYSCDKLKNITLSDALTKIGNYAFDGCISLETIELPSGLTSLGIASFRGCAALKSIYIPQSVITIGNSAFNGCKSLSEITVSNDNRYYLSENGVLFNKNKTNLIQYPIGSLRVEYIVPDSVVNIKESAFSHCGKLKNILMSSNVENIGKEALAYCYELESIVIPNSVKTIDVRAFYYCERLKEIVIPNSVTNVGSGAFAFCNGLESVTLLCDLETIAEEMFQECENLKSVNIPNSVKSIGTRAFGHCVNLSSVTIPSSVVTIGDRAFYGCEGLISVLISDGVESIEEFAFCECANITSISIPESITKIEIGVFNHCDMLGNIYVDDNNLNYCSVDGILFDKDKKILIQYPKGKKDSSYVIPNSVIVINDYAFINCENLKNIEMPERLTTIGDEAFTACTNLKSFKFYNALTNLGISCFSGCSSLEKVEFSNGITEIPEWSFSSCKSLKTVTLPNTIKNIHNYAFYNCISLIGVYYDGTRAEWDAIYIARKNEPLVNSKVHFQYTKTSVSLDGKTFTVSPVNIENGKTVILALYNEEHFVEMQSAVYTGEVIPFTTIKKYTKAKVFVWDDLKKLTPVCEAEIVK